MSALSNDSPSTIQSQLSSDIPDVKLRSKNDYEIVIRMLNCNLDLSHEISGSKVWLSLEHPKAEVRRSALLGLEVRGMLNVEAANSQFLDFVRREIDAPIRS